MSLISEISAAAELQEQFDKLNNEDRNLSVKGALSEAVRLGGKDTQADQILAEIEVGTADGKLLKGAFTRLTMAQRNFARTSILKPERMSSYLGEGAEALVRMQISRASMMLAVVRVSTVQEPQIWGEQISPSSLATALAKLKEKIASAHQRIEQTLKLDDFTVHSDITSPDREEGKSILSFKITGGQLRLGDGRDIGARLVSWWLEHGSVKAKKKVA